MNHGIYLSLNLSGVGRLDTLMNWATSNKYPIEDLYIS